MRDMKFIDNQKGIFLSANGEKLSNKVEAYNIEIYGESRSNDCPTFNLADESCYCPDKIGFMLFGGHLGSKALHPIT
jgi:hypothetical protein